MPWNAKMAEVLAAHGFDAGRGVFVGGGGLPAPSCAALLRALVGIGSGANPMPFPKPNFVGCELRHRQSVATGRGTDVTMEHVLVTADGRGFGLVRNLQTCIYGKVRHGVELELTDFGRTGARSGGLFGLGGSGATQATWRATGAEVAIKCIERTKYEQHCARHAGRLNEDPIKEVAVMNYVARAGGAAYVLPMLGCYADDQAVYVIMPLCPHGDLFGVVEAQGALPERTAATYMGQIVAGLERLHALGLAHHDMSLENLLLDSERRAIIIDFGMAVKTYPTFTRFLPERRAAATTHAVGAAGPFPPPPPGHERDEHANNAGPSYFAVPISPHKGWPCRCGKLLYMAPELFEAREPFDAFAADVWALGIILFLLLTGMPPWDAASGPTPTDMRYVYVRDGRLDELLRTWNITLSAHAPDLLQKLLTADPRNRLTLPQLKAHPWWRANAQYVDVPV